MTVHVHSFSYRRGLPADPYDNGGGFVFDCRSLPNPFWKPELRSFTGRDRSVVDFFKDYEEDVGAFLVAAWTMVRQSIKAYVKDGRDHLYVAFGCTGGQHRSVFFAERMAEQLRSLGNVDVELAHDAREFWKTEG